MNDLKVDNSSFEFLLDMLQTKMCDPKSKYYLPGLVPQLKNPNLDPYSTPDNWPLTGLTGPSIVTASNQICLQATPDKYCPEQGIGNGGPGIKLSNIIITGLVNVLPEKPDITDPTSNQPKVSVVLDFCTITGNPSLPTVITISGDFSLSQNCCIPPRGSQTCGNGDPAFNTSGDGTFTTTLTPGTGLDPLQMTCKSFITVQQPSRDFLVTITGIETNISTNSMQTSVTINSTGKGDKKTYEKLAEEALNNDDAKTQILAAFQSEVNSDSTKADIGKMISDNLNNLFPGARDEFKKRLSV